MRSSRFSVAGAGLLAGLAAAALPSLSQDQRTRLPAFGTGVEVVRLDVSVLNGEGRFVTDLRVGDLEIYEDGRLQKSTSFVRRDLPLSLILLLDASASIADRLPLARAAVMGFLEALRPQDDASVIAFSDSVSVLQEATSDRDALHPAIDTISAGGATALYNALYVTLEPIRAEKRDAELRRRAILLLSDGADTASLVWEEQVVELARRCEVTIHVIDLRPRDHEDASARLLEVLSHESGGEVHRPASIHDLEAVYSRVGEELKSQYTLGYVSSDASQDGRWRSIQVRVRGRRELQLRHRTGYYAVP